MDYARLTSDVKAVRKPWTFESYLPDKVLLYHRTKSGHAERLGTLNPKETVSRTRSNAAPLQIGDTIEVVYESNGNGYLMMPPYTLHPHWRDVKVGTVTYESAGGGREYSVSFADISGVMIHNNLLFPLDVYHLPRDTDTRTLVAQVEAYDGVSYMGGSRANVYYDNSREGLRLGDRLAFVFNLPDRKPVMTITLTDNHMYHINVGVIDAGYDDYAPDTYGYSVDRPVQTGITYYDASGSPTNPNAAF